VKKNTLIKSQEGIILMKSSRKNLLVLAVVCVMVISFLMVAAADFVPIEYRGYANLDVLISADELTEIMDRDDVKIDDFRNMAQYMTGHVPGATNVWRSDQENPDAEFAV